MKKLLEVLVAVLLATVVYATTLTCSIDNSGLWRTGQVRAEYGKLLYEHKCFTAGHIYWLTEEQTNR